MLKLTMVGREARPIFVNPRMVAHVYPRTVRERVTPDPPPPGTTNIEWADRVEGCFVNFGAGGDDSDLPIAEAVDDVAEAVSEAMDHSYGVIDVAANLRERAKKAEAEAARRAAAGCSFPENPSCECAFCTDIPF